MIIILVILKNKRPDFIKLYMFESKITIVCNFKPQLMK